MKVFFAHAKVPGGIDSQTQSCTFGNGNGCFLPQPSAQHFGGRKSNFLSPISSGVCFLVGILMSEQATSKLTRKGLAEGSMGMLAIVTLGVSVIAPAYALTATMGPTASVVGNHMPAVFLVGFIPMLLVALGYRELNADAPDSGTSFTWAT